MYEFVDISQPIRSPVYPIALTFNGVRFEDALNNVNGSYRTLTVKGRGLVNQEHQSIKPAGKNGSYFYSQTLENRTLTIKVKLTGKNNLAFRRQYEKFNQLLKTVAPSFLSFSDEVDRSYFAQFKACDEPEEESNEAILTLEFICYDPFKYSDVKSVSGNRITYAGDEDTKPILTITLTAGGNELRVLHLEKQQYIRLKGTYTTGNKIVIDMKKRTITQNGRSILPDLDVVNSRFFTFSKGVNTLSINLAHTVTSEFREVYL